MAKKFPIYPKHPERICWGCDKYCSAEDLQCGNGCERIQHPCELDGPEWYKSGDWSNLLSEQQQRELGLLPEPQQPKAAKPHIKLPVKQNCAECSGLTLNRYAPHHRTLVWGDGPDLK